MGAAPAKKKEAVMPESQAAITVELKNTKISQDLSRETMAFTSSVYVNGTRAFTVMNDGQGASHQYDILGSPGSAARTRNIELFKQAEQHATAADPTGFEPLDNLIDNLISADEEERELRGWCRKMIVLKLPGNPEGEYLSVKRKYTPDLKPALLKKYPGAEIINERFT